MIAEYLEVIPSSTPRSFSVSAAGPDAAKPKEFCFVFW